jgi:glutamate dehydrogenase/leucine dehydrogenase
MDQIIELLEHYKSESPEVVFEWNDKETEARGWIVINSLKGGAAGGGTRMRKGLTKDEVISLAKVMEIKFTVSGPQIGGAKSGIDFDPRDPRRDEVLDRWFKTVTPLLKNYYGTGGDLNVDELKDVIPITEKYGLWHPQEGIVNGHLNADPAKKIKVLGQLRQGVSKIVEDPEYIPESDHKYAVADMITGFGVAEAVRKYYKIFLNQDVYDKRVIVQGWGNVASAASLFLAKWGAKTVGIIDLAGGLVDENGMDLTRVETLFANKENNKLADPGMIRFADCNESIWDVPADIFIPGAASKIVSPDQIGRLINNGLEVVSCGANVPFTDDKVFFGPTAMKVDEEIALIPDFIANCGMARVFAHLMSNQLELTDSSIFEDVSRTIEHALWEVKEVAPDQKYNLSHHALRIALNKLGQMT